MTPKLITKRNAAFTLVELLVVIGIIAVLIGILMPALSAARKQAKLVACASNMRQIATAAILYCGDNKGYLPPRFNAGIESINYSGNGINNYIYLESQGTAGFACNLGILCTGGYLASFNPATFFGTSPTSSSNNLNLAPMRFDPAVDAQNLALQVDWAYSSDYFFNPHWAYTSATGTWPLFANAIVPNSDQVSQYNRIAQYSAYRALVSELIFSQGTAAHAANDQLSGKFNLAYSDGHVSTVNDTILFNYATSGARWYYNSTTGAFSSGKAITFDDDLDILETEAAGKNTLTTVADPNDALCTPASPYLYRLQKAGVYVPGTGNDHPAVPWK
jgi:prepilin-type N-terminal cleavage/methylation domain-containing protein/prepilin-type processing-associated H-X9-DG protein